MVCFPQLSFLGKTITSKFYGIKDLEEAKVYYNHEILRERLIESSNALMGLDTNNIHEVMSSPDDLKLKSSMTLFSLIENSDEILKRFYVSTLNVKRYAYNKFYK